MGTNISGFVKDYNNGTNGTNSTYFADYSRIIPSYFGYCGGYLNDGA